MKLAKQTFVLGIAVAGLLAAGCPGDEDKEKEDKCTTRAAVCTCESC